MAALGCFQHSWPPFLTSSGARAGWIIKFAVVPSIFSAAGAGIIPSAAPTATAAGDSSNISRNKAAGIHYKFRVSFFPASPHLTTLLKLPFFGAQTIWFLKDFRSKNQLFSPYQPRTWWATAPTGAGPDVSQPPQPDSLWTGHQGHRKAIGRGMNGWTGRHDLPLWHRRTINTRLGKSPWDHRL